MSDRMFERDEAGVEGDGAVVVAARSAIFEVALDGASDVGQLAANLMMTACMEVDIEEVVATVGDGNFSVFEARQLGVGSCGAEDIAFISFLILDKPVLEGTDRLRRGVLHDCPVVFLELAGAHLLHHAAESLGGFSEEDNTRDRTVETVDDATIDLARFMVAFLDELLHEISQTGVASLVTLCNLAREFVDSQQVVVLV